MTGPDISCTVQAMSPSLLLPLASPPPSHSHPWAPLISCHGMAWGESAPLSARPHISILVTTSAHPQLPEHSLLPPPSSEHECPCGGHGCGRTAKVNESYCMHHISVLFVSHTDRSHCHQGMPWQPVALQGGRRHRCLSSRHRGTERGSASALSGFAVATCKATADLQVPLFVASCKKCIMLHLRMKIFCIPSSIFLSMFVGHDSCGLHRIREACTF